MTEKGNKVHNLCGIMVKNIANYSLIALKKIWRFNYNSLIAYDVQELFSFNFNILFFSLLIFKLNNVIRHNCYNCQIGETFPNMHLSVQIQQ